MAWVREQRKRKVELLRKRAVRVYAVVTRSEYLGIGGSEVLDSITESFALNRSTRSVSQRIKPQQYVLAGKI